MSGIASLAEERLGEMARTVEEALRAVENLVEAAAGPVAGSTGGEADG